MSIDTRIKEKKAMGNNLLIIFVTAGVGGLLNAIANMQVLDWNLFEIGLKIDIVLSSIFIVTGIILRQALFRSADKLWPK